jgi:23S rRNA (guanine2445-N2)-methyltransferase / 23S rRNA (guanine2069-N7)-methyltransferase
MNTSLFAAAPRHTEDLLAAELAGCGAADIHQHPGGVAFSGDLEVAYRACLWSRVATRVLLPLGEVRAGSPDELRRSVQAIDWSLHMSPATSFAVSCTAVSPAIEHTHYAALLAKDGVADYFRTAKGRRPRVDTKRPDLRLHLHLGGDRGRVHLDISGESLHRRGYRKGQGRAPLKENVAAAALMRAHWPELCQGNVPFIDPMCGSGTIAIEAAMMAADVAPGLLRRGFGFAGWRGHDVGLWGRLTREARGRRKAGYAAPILGYDADEEIIGVARANAAAAELDQMLRFEAMPVDEVAPPGPLPGLIVTNPPYGKRLAEEEDLPGLYASLGRVMKSRFVGWSVSVLTADEELSFATGLRAERVSSLYNGPIACKLAHFKIPRPLTGRRPEARGPKRGGRQP